MPNAAPIAPPSERPERRSSRALDLRGFLPSALMLLAQKIAASASAAYRPRFGVGLTQWRILAALGAEPWISPARICEASGLDKAAVSRALGGLRAAGWVESEDDRARGGAHALTASGLALHDALVAAAGVRERELLAGFTEQERAALGRFLRRIGENADRMPPSAEF